MPILYLPWQLVFLAYLVKVLKAEERAQASPVEV